MDTTSSLFWGRHGNAANVSPGELQGLEAYCLSRQRASGEIGTPQRQLLASLQQKRWPAKIIQI